MRSHTEPWFERPRSGDGSAMRLGRTLCALFVAAAIAPGTALAHHHHHGVVLKGTVTSVDASNSTLVVKVERATRGGDVLEGDNVTIKAVKGWVADTNNDGKRSIADVQDGDAVLVFTKRRFVDSDANTVAAAFVVDKTHPARTAGTGDSRDGDGHDCDHR